MPQQPGNTAADTITISRQEYEELQELKFKYARLEAQMADMKRMIFGTKSERFVSNDNPDQLNLEMEGVEAVSDEKPPEKET